MQQFKDHVAGFVMRGKKWNLEKQQFEPAMFLDVYTYEVDANGEPIKQGTFKLRNGQTRDNYKLSKLFRIPLSTLTEVVEGKKRKCQFFWSQKQ